MCGRYSFAKPNIERFGLRQLEFEFEPRYNIASSQQVPVVIRQNGDNRLHMLRWGLIPYWAKGISMKGTMQSWNSKRQMKDIPRRDLPAGVKEGDVIRFLDVEYVLDKLETERITKETGTMFDKLWE